MTDKDRTRSLKHESSTVAQERKQPCFFTSWGREHQQCKPGCWSTCASWALRSHGAQAGSSAFPSPPRILPWGGAVCICVLRKVLNEELGPLTRSEKGQGLCVFQFNRTCPSYILFFMADPTATSNVRSMEVCSLSVGQECDSQESCANIWICWAWGIYLREVPFRRN